MNFERSRRLGIVFLGLFLASSLGIAAVPQKSLPAIESASKLHSRAKSHAQLAMGSAQVSRSPAGFADGINKPILMLTGFEPFGGSAQNNSWRVVTQLSESPQLKAIFDVRPCLLPVDYDHGAEIALQCLHSLPRAPVAVVSFGEAACKTQLERRYVNWDNTSIPDNAGVLRQGSKIVESGPEELGPTLSVEQMMATVSSRDSGKVIFSDDAGRYVCNNTAYWMADSLMSQAGGSPPKTGFAFIHVPNTQCRAADADPQMLTQMISPMLVAAVPHPVSDSRSNVASGGVLPFSQ